jgi:DnaJ-class molecular chaperone
MTEQWTERCASCQGYGWRPMSASTLRPDWRRCSWCGGRGWITYRHERIETLAPRAEAPATEGEGR